jgi:putative thioredoxin
MRTQPSADYIVETTSATFEQDVVERSKSVPVVVDFWAEWCAPCRMLAPVLERLAREYAGKFILVKSNIDVMPEIAGRFGVRSIPAVMGIVDAAVRDSFVGVLPESAIREFVEGLLPTAAESLAREATALTSSDAAGAESLFRDALTRDPRSPSIQIAFARFLFDTGRDQESRALIEQLERRGFLEPEAERLKAELLLRAGATHAGSVERARHDSEANPNDLGARLRLAEALASGGQHEEALRIALELVERDRRGVGEDARMLMLAIFNLLPPDSPLAAEFRRQLSLVL